MKYLILALALFSFNVSAGCEPVIVTDTDGNTTVVTICTND